MKATDFRAMVPELRRVYQAQRQESGGTFNAFLMAQYRAATGQEDFRTYKAWREAGFQVKRGESSFPLFSRPLGALKAEKQPGYQPGTEAGDRYFKTAHLFHRGQVEPIGGHQEAQPCAETAELLKEEAGA